MGEISLRGRINAAPSALTCRFTCAARRCSLRPPSELGPPERNDPIEPPFERARERGRSLEAGETGEASLCKCACVRPCKMEHFPSFNKRLSGWQELMVEKRTMI
ncbi:hypothetical protein AAFF_G00108450 [Aldrovandia affinis]|uniref:Uncharacterized protein n=1 Tax=Aldrovandia affinis TaxID=143900 RepID=A0AAD7RWE9_9TELE|nr:hypothetical protein AAFF_G00108450 [Aldrovandia affinis]